MSSSNGPLRREPPVTVRRELAAEVGFGCPIEGCGSPYLTWHHFDPPWRKEEHHRPDGMIAICRDHHREADASAFTVEQLHELKRVGRDRNQPLGARFNWMRDELLAVVGGNFYLRTQIAVQVEDMPVVWFNRDDSGLLLVNLQVLTTSGEPRMAMIDNFWITEGADEREIRCPPSDRLVEAKYPNGDRLKIEFHEIESIEDFDWRYPKSHPLDQASPKQKAHLEAMSVGGNEERSQRDTIERIGIQFPLAVVEITMKIGGTDLDLGPTATAVAGTIVTGAWIVDCGVGIQVGESSNP